jgi:hypothetical protein
MYFASRGTNPRAAEAKDASLKHIHAFGVPSDKNNFSAGTELIFLQGILIPSVPRASPGSTSE